MNARPGSRGADRPPRQTGQSERSDGSGDRGGRGERPAPRRTGRRPAGSPVPPRRQPADRAKVIFSVVGLVVIFSLVIGTVFYGHDTQGIEDTDAGQDPASTRGQANLWSSY